MEQPELAYVGEGRGEALTSQADGVSAQPSSLLLQP